MENEEKITKLKLDNEFYLNEYRKLTMENEEILKKYNDMQNIFNIEYEKLKDEFLKLGYKL